MRKIILLLLLLSFSISCSKDDCDAQRTELENLRSQGWTNCNGSSACIKKIEEDYQKRLTTINNNCN